MDDDIGAAKGAVPPRTRWAMTTFVALFSLNMLDYLDRNLLVSMQPQIKGDLGITNFSWGLLTSIFLVSYSLFGPVMGAVVYLLLEEFLSQLTEYWALIMGPLLLLVVLFGRGGIMGLLGRFNRG